MKKLTFHDIFISPRVGNHVLEKLYEPKTTLEIKILVYIFMSPRHLHTVNGLRGTSDLKIYETDSKIASSFAVVEREILKAFNKIYPDIAKKILGDLSGKQTTINFITPIRTRTDLKKHHKRAEELCYELNKEFDAIDASGAKVILLRNRSRIEFSIKTTSDKLI